LAARRFLYAIAVLFALVLIAGIGWALFQDRMLRAAFVPAVPFAPPTATPGPDYRLATSWFSRPDRIDDPSNWLPAGVAPAPDADRRVPVFFVPPTSSLARDRWNAPIASDDAFQRGRLFVSSQASVFTGIGRVWAPRYRQATLGAFLTTERDARLALDFAYGDVAKAFDAFLAGIPADQPFILAGHSQGSLHLTRLLAERIAGKPLASRVIAAYPVGWPISVDADLPALGMPACTQPDQARCIVAFQSFAEPADPHQIVAIYDATRGLAGASRKGTPMLCVNPVLGRTGADAAPAAANMGSIVPDLALAGATFVTGRVPARCDARGLLLIGSGPQDFGRFILPGNNYHVFDYAMFWTNLRNDAARRVRAFGAR
jgi:hypothetical protein